MEGQIEWGESAHIRIPTEGGKVGLLAQHPVLQQVIHKTFDLAWVSFLCEHAWPTYMSPGAYVQPFYIKAAKIIGPTAAEIARRCEADIDFVSALAGLVSLSRLLLRN